MRAAFFAFVAAALATAGVLASSAFNDGSGASRAITVSLVGDAAAYLGVSATQGLHRCFVSEDAATGKLAISFDSAAACPNAGTGAGVNAGGGSKYSRYSFHDLLTVKNQGQKTVYVWVNASTTSASPNAILVAKKATSASMTDSDYYATSATAIQLASIASLYVGVQTNTTLAAGSTLSGTITVDARV